MEIEELEQMLRDTRSPKDFFGDDIEKSHKRYLQICHPDRNVGNPKAIELFQKITEWMEEAKKPSIIIKSPKKKYEILRRLAIGDVSDLFTAENGKKDYILKISRIDGGDVYLNNEKENITKILTQAKGNTYSKYLPTLVESFAAKDTIAKRVNIFDYDPGFYTLEQVKQKYPEGIDGRHLGWIFNRMLTGLGFFHNCGLVHGAVLPSHVLVKPENHGAMFCGWVHSIKIGEKIDTISVKYKDWYPPEVITKKPLTSSTDIYMAAKCVLDLGGKDIPFKIDRFLKSCLLDSPGMRPQNAWELLDEFKVVLEGLYGKRRFTVFTMS